MPPAKHLAVVACMDARLNVYGLLGLSEGDAHVIRNAGGIVTQDELRSLAISQRLLGTTEIILIHHTDCGMLTCKDDEFRQSIEAETGSSPPGPPRHSPIWTSTCARTSPGSTPKPLSPSRIRCAVSCTTWPPAHSAR